MRDVNQFSVTQAVKDSFDHWLAGSPTQATKLLDWVVERAVERLERCCAIPYHERQLEQLQGGRVSLYLDLPVGVNNDAYEVWRDRHLFLRTLSAGAPPDALFLGAALAAAVVTWFTFLPSFLFILAGGPLVESTHGELKFTAPLTGITAAVVGVILNLALWVAWHTWFAGGAFHPAMAGLSVLAMLGLSLVFAPPPAVMSADDVERARAARMTTLTA